MRKRFLWLPLLLLMAAIYTAFPLLGETVLTWWLSRQGIQVVAAEFGHPGWSYWQVHQLQARNRSAGWQLDLSGATLHAPLHELALGGVPRAVTVRRIAVTNEPRTDQPTDLSAALRLIAQVNQTPTEVTITQIDYHQHRQGAPFWQYQGQASFRKGLLAMTGSVQIFLEKAQPSALQIHLTQPDRHHWELSTSSNGSSLLTLSGNLPGADKLTIEGSLSAQLGPLLALLPVQSLPSELAAHLGSLSGTLAGTWQAESGSPQLSPEHLRIAHQFELQLQTTDPLPSEADLRGSLAWQQQQISWQLAPQSFIRLQIPKTNLQPAEAVADLGRGSQLPVEVRATRPLVGRYDIERASLFDIDGEVTAEWRPAGRSQNIFVRLFKPHWNGQHFNLELAAGGLLLPSSQRPAFWRSPLRFNIAAALSGNADILHIDLKKGSLLNSALTLPENEALSIRASLLDRMRLSYAKDRASLSPTNFHVQLGALQQQQFHLQPLDLLLNLEPVTSLPPASLRGLIQIPHIEASLPDWQIPPWYANLYFHWRPDRLTTTGRLTAPSQGIDIDLQGNYQPLLSTGHLRWQVPEQHFSKLWQWYQKRPAILIDQGTVAFEGDLILQDQHWHMSQTTWLRDLSGQFDTTRWSGLSGTLDASLDHALLGLVNGDLSLPLLDIGIPVEQIAISFALDSAASQAPKLSVSKGSALLLGGGLQTSSFTLDLAKQQGQITVLLENLDLNRILALEQQPFLKGEGRLSGKVPIRWQQGQWHVERGVLQAEEPGGWIRYQPPDGMIPNSAPLKMALEALDNFQFMELKSGIDYQPDGTLSLATTLKGSNPHWQQGRPLHLNLNVEENLIQLLRSLRLSGKISQSLEKRLSSDKAKRRSQ